MIARLIDDKVIYYFFTTIMAFMAGEMRLEDRSCGNGKST